jgi:hypothetical protein
MTDLSEYQKRHESGIARAKRLLPAWFVERMMTDSWYFGLLLVTGQVLVIESIRDVRGTEGNVWIDVTMYGKDGNHTFHEFKDLRWPCVYSPTGRTEASVNAAHVVAAFELMDS